MAVGRLTFRSHGLWSVTKIARVRAEVRAEKQPPGALFASNTSWKRFARRKGRRELRREVQGGCEWGRFAMNSYRGGPARAQSLQFFV